MTDRPNRRPPPGVLLLALAVPGCAALPPDDRALAESRAAEQERVADRAAIRRVLDDLELAESTGNRAALEAVYAPDARWQPPDGPAAEGRGAVLDAYDELLEGHDLSTVLEEQSLEPHGDEAQFRGWLTRTRTPHDGGPAVSETLFVRVVLAQDPEQGWRIRFVGWRPWRDLAPPAADEEPGAAPG